MQASASDMVEVERGLRQMHELGVEAAVMAALADQARARRAKLQLPATTTVRCSATM